MAILKRSTLKEWGLNDEQVEKVMSETARALANDYTLKSDVQAQVEKAVEDAKKTMPTPDVKNSEEYVKLQADFDAYKAKETARHSDAFKGVKDKFFDEVYSKVDKDKDIPQQLTAIKAEYEEYFEPETQPESKPTFGAPSGGGMPKGKNGGLLSAWGYDQKFKE